MSGVPLLVCVENEYEGPFVPLVKVFTHLRVEGLAAPADKVFVYAINQKLNHLVGIFDMNGRFPVALTGCSHVWARREGGGFSSVSVWLE